MKNISRKIVDNLDKKTDSIERKSDASNPNFSDEKEYNKSAEMGFESLEWAIGLMAKGFADAAGERKPIGTGAQIVGQLYDTLSKLEKAMTSAVKKI